MPTSWSDNSAFNSYVRIAVYDFKRTRRKHRFLVSRAVTVRRRRRCVFAVVIVPAEFRECRLVFRRSTGAEIRWVF